MRMSTRIAILAGLISCLIFGIYQLGTLSFVLVIIFFSWLLYNNQYPEVKSC